MGSLLLEKVWEKTLSQEPDAHAPDVRELLFRPPEFFRVPVIDPLKELQVDGSRDLRVELKTFSHDPNAHSK